MAGPMAACHFTQKRLSHDISLDKKHLLRIVMLFHTVYSKQKNIGSIILVLGLMQGEIFDFFAYFLSVWLCHWGCHWHIFIKENMFDIKAFDRIFLQAYGLFPRIVHDKKKKIGTTILVLSLIFSTIDLFQSIKTLAKAANAGSNPPMAVPQLKQHIL